MLRADRRRGLWRVVEVVEHSANRGPERYRTRRHDPGREHVDDDAQLGLPDADAGGTTTRSAGTTKPVHHSSSNGTLNTAASGSGG